MRINIRGDERGDPKDRPFFVHIRGPLGNTGYPRPPLCPE